MSMESNKRNMATYKDYGELWNFNLQKIEHIHNEIEKSINELENKYIDFESAYAGITQQLDILSSIYSGYNTVQGSESVMRLKSVLASYRKRYTRESLDFNLVYSLLIKIADVRNASFEDFPRLSHEEMPVALKEGETPEIDYSRRSHKWVTFERNRSWFIAPFTIITILKNDNSPVVSVEEPDYFTLAINDTTLRIKDIFIKSLDHPDSPRHVIMLDRMTKNYAADRIGRRIYSDRDIIKPMLRPFKSVQAHPLSPGRIRLFGKNHLLLN